jgi:heptosyltransferase-1
LHATARPEKQWAEEHWVALGKALGRDTKLVLPWGSEPERARSERISAVVPGASIPARAPLDQVAKLIAGAQYVVGVDTGLMHLAAAFGVPLVAIFTGSNPGLTGPVGNGRLTVLGAAGAPPSIDAVVDAVRKITRAI